MKAIRNRTVLAAAALIAVAIVLVILSGRTTPTVSAQNFPSPLDEGSGGIDYGPSDAMSESESAALLEAAYANIERLRIEGRLPSMRGLIAEPTMDWPMRNAPGARDFNIGLVTYFVDHNPAFPNQVLDWNCGIRTYDQPDGSNHAGTDIVTQVFPWKHKNNNDVNAIAAESGVIVTKSDGFPDSNCVNGGSPPVNEIQILHRDGSIGRYLHFKSGSLTSKGIGDFVFKGEYLGVPGSSGRSNVPHLHFELRDIHGNLQDPYEGACNTLNTESRWTKQEPYRNSQILNMMTGSAAPAFQGCPNEEVSNEKIVFQPGDTLVTTAFYRDQQLGQVTDHSVMQPDGNTFVQWQITSPTTYNILQYWFRTWQLPPDAPAGRWAFTAKYDGKEYVRYFYVGQPPNVSMSGTVMSRDGDPLGGAIVTLTDLTSVASRSTASVPPGYFGFNDLVVGKTYRLDISAKGHQFNSRTFTIESAIENLDLRAR